MSDLILILIPILLADVINPVLLAAEIYTIGTRRPYLNTAALLLGWLVPYFLSGIGLAIAFEAIEEWLQNPRPLDYAIEAAIGGFLFGIGVRSILPGRTYPKKRKGPEYKEASTLSTFGAFALGAQINLIGLPFALPYFGAIDQILKAELSTAGAASALLFYNVLYVLPFAALLAVRAALGDGGDAFLDRINRGMEKAGQVLMPVIIVLLGAALVADALTFFIRGKSLF